LIAAPPSLHIVRPFRRLLSVGVSNARTVSILGHILIVLIVSVPRDARGSSLRILNDDFEALQARIDLIQQAEHSIDLAYYAVDTGDAPIAILELLRQASCRGVSVRLLVDGLMSKVPDHLTKYLRRSGIQIRFYHHPPEGCLRWLNRRMHSKLIVADSNRAIVGSRNLEDRHFGLAEGSNFVDCEALVAGEIVPQVGNYFEWLWQLPDVQPSEGCESVSLKRRSFRSFELQRLLDRSVEKVVCRSGLQLESTRNWTDGAIDDLQISLLHDCRADKSKRHFQRQIVRMLDRATCSILIVTPYPAFDQDIRAAISRATNRGVDVTILTNSLNATDKICVYAAYQNHKRRLLRDGVNLREYQGHGALHAKVMIVDGATWMLGSHNFDARSNKLNLEISIVSHSSEGAAHLRRAIGKRFARSTPIHGRKLLLRVGHDYSLRKRTGLILNRAVVELYRDLL